MKRKLEGTMMIAVLLGFFLATSASGQIGGIRVWTDTQGRKIEARLLRIDGNSVLLKIGIREHLTELSKLSVEDRRYVDSLRPVPPAGKITEYPVSPKAELAAWLTANHMKSLQWNGKPDKYSEAMRLPFQLHVPPMEKRKPGEKLPLLVHLHGTGGIGTDNLKQWTDGGGVAKLFMDKQFQGYQATYIMLPQTARMSGWYALAYTDPSEELEAIVHAIRLMAASPDYQVDLSRIYITGLSMGGAGAFQAMAKFPGFFAAAIPIAYVDTPKIFNEGNCGPMWIAINANDSNYEERLAAFRKHYLAMGGKIRATVFDKGGHDAWTALLGDKKFRNWLFRRELE